MGEVGARADVEKFLSLGDDLIGILRNNKDVDVLTQAVEGARTLHSAHRADVNEVETALEEYQKMINTCKEKIDKARSDTVADSEIENLQNELEEKLQKQSLLREELR
ncbi:uncharacterized protein M6B38_127345 [Iris pallida]|uniref:Uncharacterized protein n=1 Tax=Iris pallida TaxID=29817 RepID=A0AAX6G655_IRIPA|nr:uncharacterized protein M6B38_127345 [Iris pallida]